MCMDCFRTYGITKLNDRQFVETRDAGYTLACPGMQIAWWFNVNKQILSVSIAGCEDSHIKEAHHFRLLGDSEVSNGMQLSCSTENYVVLFFQYERFHRFGTEEFVLQAGGVLCPNVGCGMGLLPEGRERRLQCTNCRVRLPSYCHPVVHVWRRPVFIAACLLSQLQGSISSGSVSSCSCDTTSSWRCQRMHDI